MLTAKCSRLTYSSYPISYVVSHESALYNPGPPSEPTQTHAGETDYGIRCAKYSVSGGLPARRCRNTEYGKKIRRIGNESGLCESVALSSKSRMLTVVPTHESAVNHWHPVLRDADRCPAQRTSFDGHSHRAALEHSQSTSRVCRSAQSLCIPGVPRQPALTCPDLDLRQIRQTKNPGRG